ncbi:beta strand repeat-containing protein [Legionella sainthelensi]|uniref:beta strand repeat-containing protein n=1 Tax=Legionella sainthelensi TaxID=28087 RepID=UPI000E207EE2|nr:Ig-like domain-containing protein [Legionella sainthelensi]
MNSIKQRLTLAMGFLFLLATSVLFAGTQPKFSIIPTTATTKQISTTSNDTVQYLVTNNTTITRTLTTKPIPGVTQIVAGGGCSSPFTLAPKASCYLTLNLDGSLLPRHVTSGPEVCKTKGAGNNMPDPFLCSQPSAADSLNLTVVPATATLVSIHVTPVAASIANGTFQQYTATGIYSNGTTQNLTNLVTWSSTNANIASVSNADGSKGLVTANSPGQTSIAAALGNLSDSTTLTVTTATLQAISVSPTNQTIPKGISLQYTATGLFSNGTKQDLTNFVTWSSSTAAATISNNPGSKGVATGANPGATTISATFNTTTGSTSLNVTAATLNSIAVTPVNASIPSGISLQYTATGNFSDGSVHDITNFVVWSSSTAAATISNSNGSKGLATGATPGATTITARLGAITGTAQLNITAAVLTNITVLPPNPSIASGTTQQFIAVGTFSDKTHALLTDQVAWTSSNPSTSRISNAAGSNGLAIGLQVGSSVITATLGSVYGSANLTVTAATLSRIEVTPVNQSIPAGTTQQYKATGVYSNLTTQDLTDVVVWNSSDEVFATISNAPGTSGLATGKQAGTTTISATLGSVSGSTSLTVNAAALTSITVTPNNASLANGLQLQYTATGHYSNGTTQDLTTQVVWASSNTTVAVISNAAGSNGLATGTSQGGTTISATMGAISGNTALTVTAAQLTSLFVVPLSTSVTVDATKQFFAVGFFSDATFQNLTDFVTWSSSDTSLAVISPQGLATGVAAGSVTITASLNSTVSNGASLTVTNPAVTSIEVTGGGDFLVGTQAQLSAVATYSNGLREDVTTQAVWSSSNTAVASVSNADGSQGLATAVSPGTATMQADFGGAFGTTSFMVLATRPTTAFVSLLNTHTVEGCNVLATGYFDTPCISNTATPNNAAGMALTADGTRIYIANSFPSNDITQCMVSGETLGSCASAMVSIPSPFQPTAIALNHAQTKAYITSGSIVYVCNIDSGTGNLSGCTNAGYNFSADSAVTFDIVISNSDFYAYITTTGRSRIYKCTINTSNGTFTGCVHSDASGQTWGIAILNTDLGLYYTDKNGGVISYCPLDSSGNIEGCHALDALFDLSTFPQPVGVAIHGNNKLIYVADENGYVAVCPIEEDKTLGPCQLAEPQDSFPRYFITMH